MAVFEANNLLDTWLVTVSTIAAAATPYLAYKFRERRARRPKTPHEQLYAYYENFIKLLNEELEKKDVLIDALEKQNRELRKVIEEQRLKLDEQSRQLDQSQRLIEQLKDEINRMQEAGQGLQAHLTELKTKVINTTEPPINKQ